jgi:glycerol-3-phosphate acyltransferase PlsY
LNFQARRQIPPQTGLGVLLAKSWPVGVGAAAAFAVVLAVFPDCFPEFRCSPGVLTAIALVCAAWSNPCPKSRAGGLQAAST